MASLVLHRTFSYEKCWRVKFVTNIITTATVYEGLKWRFLVQARMTKCSTQFLSIFSCDSKRTFCESNENTLVFRTFYIFNRRLSFGQSYSNSHNFIMFKWDEMAQKVTWQNLLHRGSFTAEAGTLVGRLPASTSKQSAAPTQLSHQLPILWNSPPGPTPRFLWFGGQDGFHNRRDLLFKVLGAP
jgi:hypothetical protein